MSPFRILGVGGDATEADIKRAYARLLKQHRPDTDPAGFQRLHEAYSQCLAHARYRAEYGDEDDGSEADEADALLVAEAAAEAPSMMEAGRASDALPVVVARPDPVRLQDRNVDAAGHGDAVDRPLHVEDAHIAMGREPAFDFDGFVAELMRHVRLLDAPALSHWLHTHETLYSLQLKQMLSGPVAQTLAEAEPLPDEARLQVVLDFFGLDGLGQQHGWIEHSVARLWQRLEDRRGFDRIAAEYRSPRTKPIDRMLLRELVSPRNWLRFLFVLLCPLLPSRTRSLLLTLEQEGRDEAHARMNPDAARFWRLAADRDRLDWRRWLVAFVRVPLVLVPTGYIALVSGSGPTPGMIGTACAATFGAWLAWAASSMAWRRLLRWNQAKLQWDMPLVLAGVVLCIALAVGVFLPGWSIPLSILTLMFWLAQRNGGTYYAAMFAAVLGGVWVMSLLAAAKPSTEPLGSWAYAIAGVYGVISVIAHDIVHARRARTLLVHARAQFGWLGWLVLAHVVMLVGTVIVGGVLNAPR